MKQRHHLWMRLLPLYLGIAALLCWPLWQQFAGRHHAQAAATQAETQLISKTETSADKSTTQNTGGINIPNNSGPISGLPSRIILPTAGIDLPVINGIYNAANQNWSISSTAANYATITPLVNNTNGSPLIYGHATSNVFGRTSKLKAGDPAYVYTSGGHIFEYRYNGQQVTNPTDTSVFGELSGTPGLKLLTCTGTFSQNRRIMSFTLVRAG